MPNLLLAMSAAAAGEALLIVATGFSFAKLAARLAAA